MPCVGPIRFQSLFPSPRQRPRLVSPPPLGRFAVCAPPRCKAVFRLFPPCFPPLAPGLFFVMMICFHAPIVCLMLVSPMSFSLPRVLCSMPPSCALVFYELLFSQTPACQCPFLPTTLCTDCPPPPFLLVAWRALFPFFLAAQFFPPNKWFKWLYYLEISLDAQVRFFPRPVSFSYPGFQFPVLVFF